MSINKEEILEAISSMSVTDIVELISMIEKKFSISVSSFNKEVKENNEEKNVKKKTEFDVILLSVGENKISVIKLIRSITGLGLKESKDLIESTPCTVKTNVNENDSKNIKDSLEEIGAKVEIK